MATTKHSKQRDAIRNFLISRKDHPTAEVVYAYVKQRISKYKPRDRISESLISR